LRKNQGAGCTASNSIVCASGAAKTNRATVAEAGADSTVTPIAVPVTVTVPPVAELPKTAGPRPPLDRVAVPPAPAGAIPKESLPPPPPMAMAETVACSAAMPVASALAAPPATGGPFFSTAKLV
jgi:hypothetical protein